tara:strand:+ start:1929 stop:2573 length:645 start_codon:yes stop_codon:yes gene_type:complete
MKIFAISGLGADERVFDYLKLDYELIHVKWINPSKRESIIDYSKRLISHYCIEENENFGILGVSFGGLIATEISKLTQPKFTVLISSIETQNELPFVLRLIGQLKIVELIPRKLLAPPKFIVNYYFGTNKRHLLHTIFKEADPYFTKWAIKELVSWKNKQRLDNLIHVSGANDKLLPPKGNHIILINKGAHFMIVDKANELSRVINREIKKMIS